MHVRTSFFGSCTGIYLLKSNHSCFTWSNLNSESFFCLFFLNQQLKSCWKSTGCSKGQTGFFPSIVFYPLKDLWFSLANQNQVFLGTCHSSSHREKGNTCAATFSKTCSLLIEFLIRYWYLVTFNNFIVTILNRVWVVFFFFKTCQRPNWCLNPLTLFVPPPAWSVWHPTAAGPALFWGLGPNCQRRGLHHGPVQSQRAA